MLSKIFKAYDVRATYPSPLNEAAAWKVGCASGQYFKKLAADAKASAVVPFPNTVLVSRDMRPHSPSLCNALIEGLRAAGCDVIDVGMCDTSFIYFAINHVGGIGGIQTTASHNPANYNGFKISGPQARPIGASTGLKDIQAIAESLGEPGSAKGHGQYEERDLWLPYRQHVLKFYAAPKQGRKLRVVIDASNGMAGKLVPKVFSNLPGVEIIPINFEITGSFVHEPNPLVAANMKPTQDGVIRHKADLGACFDGDADRCILTDEKGEIIGCDHLTAMLVDHFAKQAPGAPVVYDLRSSKALEEAIKAHNARPVKSRVGHVFMKAALRESAGIFGGELSGHFYFRDNFNADSGAIAFAAVLSVLGQSDKPISAHVAAFRQYPQSGEINFRCEDKETTLATLEAKYGPGAAIDKLDGVSIDAWAGKGWWFNVRASNTEPLLRLNAEARNKPQLDALLKELKPMLGTEDHGH